MEEEQVHKRRIRYKGTHPHVFGEKYKELNPEKYQEEVEKIIASGKTPVGMHIPICMNEIMEFFQIKPGQIGFDATLGYGGHTQRMLECLDGKGHIFATDVDPIESEKTKARLAAAGFGEEILTIKRTNFANIDEVTTEKFDFVLADLGVSSMQIDNPERGFSFKRDGALDLRLDPTSGQPASERLKDLSYVELVAVLSNYADEPHAELLAKAIKRKLKVNGTIDTTRQLYSVIEEALQFLPVKEQKETIKKTCQRTFQALRIDINCELEVLETFLQKLPQVLKSGGKVAILSFHSGEDRLIKKSLKALHAEGIYSDIARDVIRPTAEECNRNPRASSTKMRWAVRT